MSRLNDDITNWLGPSATHPSVAQFGALYTNTEDGCLYVFTECRYSLLERIAATAAEVELPRGEWLRVLSGHQGESFDTAPVGFFG